MWLVTAVGAVHGLNHFTYVFEQNKVYTIGRDKTCDIRFEDRSVRPKEVTLRVEGWDPTNPSKAPILSFKVEPKKDGSLPSFNALLPEYGAFGSFDRKDYIETPVDASILCAYIDHDGQGVEITPENWFFCRWVDLCLQYDQMKEEPDQVKASLRRYCVSYTESFDAAQLPNLVLAEAYQQSHACGFAICYGIRIVIPAYLHSLLAAIDGSWKKVADSQDSFSIPDETIPEFQPPMGPRVPPARQDVQSWLPKPERKTTFAGWKIMGLRAGNLAPAEKKFMVAMGAEWDDICISDPPLLSSVDFQTRISPWLKRVEESGGRNRALVVSFLNAQSTVQKSGVNWDTAVLQPCRNLGIRVAAGSVCWGAANHASVERYLETASAPGAKATAGPSTHARQSKSPDKTRAPPPEPSLPSATPHALQIPSTFPEESAAVAQAGQSSTEQTGLAKTTQTEATAPPVRKALKRRVGNPIVMDLFPMDVDEPSPSTASTPHDSQDSASKAGSVQLPSAGQTPAAPQSIIAPVSDSAPRKPSRLVRRAGQPSEFFGSYGLSALTDETPPSTARMEETPQEIRDLYEATKRGDTLPPAKRARVVSAESAKYTDDDSLSSAVAPASPPSEGSGARRTVIVAENDRDDVDMDVAEGEGGEHEDFVQKTLRQVAANRKAGRSQSVNTGNTSMPPPSVPISKRSRRSPSEEVEVVEPVKRPRLKSPEKPATGTAAGKKSKSKADKANNQPTTDPAFLLAVSKSRSKKAIDEMDREFNNLKLPRAALKKAQEKAEVEMMDIPRDYGILDDFGDEMRGNFIQVVRKDLYRKDGGLKAAVRVEDGRPNYKKFNKKEVVKRKPLEFVLVGRNDNTEEDEMGEPYWPGVSGRAKSQMSQSQALNGENEDSLPLLPRARNRKLLTQAEDDEDELAPLPPTNRRRLLPDGQAHASSSSSAKPASRSAPQRKTRAASTISEADSVASASAAAVSTRASGSARSSATIGRGKKAQAIVIDDSEEETEGVRFTPTETGRTGSGRRVRGQTDVGPPATASASVSASNRAGAKKGQSSSSATVGRRKLLANDDDEDDDVVYKAAPKKRRLG